MKNLVVSIFMVGCTYVVSAQSSTNSTPSERDIKFAKAVAEDGLMEIKLGQLAQNHAVNMNVQMEAMHMVEDHTKANEELKTIAANKNIALPTTISNEKQEKYDKLAKLNGKEFDKKYTHCMVKAHKKAICHFKKESKKGRDHELKAWAAGKIPTLENHLKGWKNACKSLK